MSRELEQRTRQTCSIAEICGVRLVVRPARDQQAIYKAALRKTGSPDQAERLLRLVLYQYVGENLWNESLHVGDDSAGLIDSRDVLEQVGQQPLELNEKQAVDLIRHTVGRTEGYPWDMFLYLATVRDFIGEREAKKFIEKTILKGEDRAYRKFFNQELDRAWRFYQQTAGKSIYEWTPEQIRWRITDLVNFFVADTYNPSDSLFFTDKRFYRRFRQEMTEVYSVAKATGLIKSGQPLTLAEHGFYQSVDTEELKAMILD